MIDGLVVSSDGSLLDALSIATKVTFLYCQNKGMPYDVLVDQKFIFNRQQADSNCRALLRLRANDFCVQISNGHLDRLLCEMETFLFLRLP